MTDVDISFDLDYLKDEIFELLEANLITEDDAPNLEQLIHRFLLKLSSEMKKTKAREEVDSDD